MARKKIEPIETLGNNVDKLTVQKSLPLFSLWRSPLTLQEFKILDIYLSRINSHNPDKRTVVFTQGELEEILEVSRIRKEDLKKRLKNLMSNPVEIEDKTNKNERFTIITLFEEAESVKDEITGRYIVKLTASQPAMKYIFNIDNLGYLRYKLRCITSIKSRFSYIMFLYIEENRFRKEWTIPLMELKMILCCEDYQDFRIFNRDVLKRIHKDLTEKTECKYKYETVKEGRTVVAIKFEVETLPKEKQEDIVPTQTIIDQYNDDTTEDPMDFVLSAIEGMRLSQAKKEEIRSVLATIPEYKLPRVNGFEYDLKFRLYHYLDQQYRAMLRRDEEKKINRKYAYLIKMLRKDAGVEEEDNI